MLITSLGFRTDVMLLALQGSDVEDGGTHLVVRTPRNPGYWWGNFVLFKEPPTSRDHAERVFDEAFPTAVYRAIGVDVTSGAAGDYAEWETGGYSVDASSVMTASRVHEPPHPQRGAVYRTLDLTSREDREAAIALQVAGTSPPASEEHRDFLARKMDAMCALQEKGCGAWFGAFVDGEMRSGMGLFSDGSGVARFQSVDTHPASRGLGLAGTLVHHVSTFGLETLGATTLVMVADPGYHAIDIYRSVGFVTSETQIQLERVPQRTPVSEHTIAP